MDTLNIHSMNELNCSGHAEALRQIAKLCQQVTSIDLTISSDESHLYPSKQGKIERNGILSIQGKVMEGLIIVVRVELARIAEDIRLSSTSLFKHLSALTEKTRFIVRPGQKSDQSSLWVELKVNASPMTMSRASAFIAELKHLNEFAKFLQAELPVNRFNTKLVKIYKGFSEILEPVNPWQGGTLEPGTRKFIDWARETIDFLTGSFCIAMASPFPIIVDFALAVLASCGLESGMPIARLLLPSISGRGLFELSRKAPGFIEVPAVKISLGTSPYELGNEMQSLLSSLSNYNTPFIFSGSHKDLQAVFHGGQGGSNDPLFPVVRHIPDMSPEILTRFAIQTAGQQLGGLPKAKEDELTGKTLDDLKGLSPDEQRRFLPMLARRMVNVWKSGKKTSALSNSSFVSRLCGLSESLAGLPSMPRGRRSPNVQGHFTEVFTDSNLLPFFKEHLMGQDIALEQLVSRLRMESLTRPLHQPIRYCAQGTPATGKSESACLLAQRLGIPYINIDAASMSDHHTAASQLLGSGRGIVGSHQSGRLEQASKHHSGAVIEVSDLDHAHPSVRSNLSDLFLQVLETGEAQSAMGAMFTCANLIFAFTMNLPGGMDEEIRKKGIGFNNSLTYHDVSERVIAEIKNMLSGAFLSRVGTPILFAPLDGNALATIVELGIKKAVLDAADRLHCHIRDIILETGIGSKVISFLETNITSFGARTLLEHGRLVAAKAFVDLQRDSKPISGKSLIVSATSNGTIIINPQ